MAMAYRARPRRRVPRRKPVDYSAMLALQLQADGIVGARREFVFHPTRKWRFDLAFEPQRLAVEIEGFGPGGRAGRHQRAAGFTADCEKYAEAAILGWRLIRVTTAQVRRGEACTWIKRAMETA